MQNLKTVDFGVAFTLTRSAPADYEDKDGNTQTAAANEPRFNYSNGVAQGLLLDASLSETAAIKGVPLFEASAGHWIIDAEFFNSEPLPGMGLNERFSGSGKMVVSYSGGTAKVWAGGQSIYTVASYTPMEPTHICEGGMATIGGLTYKPSAISDADAAALATGDFELVPFAPDELFANGEKGAWYDPSDLTTLFQDAAGTIPVTADGDPVGLMLDKSGNGNHASQSTTAAKPTYRTDGTLHWLEFDGSDDGLRTDTVDLTSFSAMLISAGIYKSTNTQVGSIFLNADLIQDEQPNSFALLYPRNASNQGALFASFDGVGSTVRTAYEDSGSAQAPDTSVITGAASDGVLSLRRNGVEKASNIYLFESIRSDYFRIGYSGAGYLNGRIYGVVAVAAGKSESEIISTESYLAAKAGVTPP